MRIVPETATEEMIVRTGDAIGLWHRDVCYPDAYDFERADGAHKAHTAMLAAAPSVGRVSREAVERVARDARAAWVKARQGDDVPADATSIWHAVATAAIAALGLELAPDAATARGGDGEEAGDA